MWTSDQISFDIGEPTDDPVLTVTITTPAGITELIAERRQIGNGLLLRGVHIQSALGPNALGIPALRSIAEGGHRGVWL